ncbi:MAG: phosphoribosylglycinamide formyltransferase [Candidatus Izemoplasmatales bacterium]|jgi:phosphoribosylglycinamide formyltransferase-1|nr:phosphoribosylglycinamide formyltransferase [Candidatus Izemoplasmatales bacterium]MDD3865092.1 phosphoribosylglycinamide formyltransferase [Candidatus Izemoplasmatales bacterium]
MVKIAVFASGNGSNFEAIVEKKQRYEVSVLICDQKNAFVLYRAKRFLIPSYVIERTAYRSIVEYEEAILKILKIYQVDWIALAGYMRIVGSILLNAFPQRILNIHPSLLPLYPGKDAIGQAIANNAKTTGVTIHYIDSGIDTGKIIAQAEVNIEPGMDEEAVRAVIQKCEHILYPQVITKLIEEENNEKGTN